VKIRTAAEGARASLVHHHDLRHADEERRKRGGLECGGETQVSVAISLPGRAKFGKSRHEEMSWLDRFFQLHTGRAVHKLDAFLFQNASN
jgi:hypothetical protein